MARKGKEVIFITGNEKNSGKTTFLNYLIKTDYSNKKTFCASVGYDGETTDELYGNVKPAVYIKKGNFALTNSVFLNSFDFDYEIIDVVPLSAMGGSPVIIKAKRDGYVKIVGLSSNYALSEIVSKMQNYVEAVLVDGAVDRITQVAVSAGNVYFVFRITLHNLRESVEKIKLLYSIFNYKKCNLNKAKNIFYLDGALTLSKIAEIPDKTDILLIEDFTKVFLNLSQWNNLVKRYNVCFNKYYNLRGFVLNLYDLSEKEFEKNFVNEKKFFIYNPYYVRL